MNERAVTMNLPAVQSVIATLACMHCGEGRTYLLRGIAFPMPQLRSVVLLREWSLRTFGETLRVFAKRLLNVYQVAEDPEL